MASISFTQFSLTPRICRWQSKGNNLPCINLWQIQDFRLNGKVVMAVPRRKKTDISAEIVSDGDGEEAVVVEKKARKTSKRASTRTKKVVESPAEEDSAVNASVGDEATADSTDDLKKPKTRTRRKASSTSKALVEEEDGGAKKPVRQKRRSKKADVVDSEAEVSDGRRANRLVDYEYHEGKKNVLWEPEKFVRASGGTASNVAVALASLGGKVAFMEKLGDDAFGQSLLYYLNSNKVQTRSVRVDDSKETAVSRTKIGKRGGLRMTSAKPCAEDSLSQSEINIDVLKQAKMFYFNSSSLLNRNMRSTTLRAIKIAKKLGNVIFFDLNLPLPLWQSSEETKMFIHEVWNLADIIEITKQELEFLCGITPTEKFDTKDNCKSKFTHYTLEVISQLWHDDLKILFVTNGTSKIHYYTKEQNGSVLGMKDPPLTPYNSDMSPGDGIVTNSGHDTIADMRLRLL